ncbi:MAG: hypothetical protein M1818_003564 [Claussenomyces sp. TS43310]|nr:MAG: hypothetical protein M1818_003564 [Claussenomyces sp. TS43310]
MAAVSGPHASSVLTPPSSSHGTRSSWEFAVPAHNQNGTRQLKSTEENERTQSGFGQIQTLQSNDATPATQTSRPDLSQKRTHTFGSTHSSKSNNATEQGYLAPSRVSALHRKNSNISEAGSAPDSLLDLYGASSASRSGVNSMDMGERKIPNGSLYDEQEDVEHSRWIHRDKLARIESQELQAAGIILPRVRAPSKPRTRDRSRDQLSSGVSKSEQSHHQPNRQRIGALPTEEADESEEPQNMDWDLRLPEEAVADHIDAYAYSSGQKGSSKIPVFKTSPLPIPQDFIERDTPMQRTRGLRQNEDDETLFYQKARGRSQSIKMLEDSAATPTPAKRTASETSPRKTNPPALRKGSNANNRAPSAQSRPATRSGSRAPSNQRPPTRSGDVKRPEGDPPWLATMYKPDPRLPPDQQLLPTVAKRLQQEQWEKEGKSGTAYDKEFRPLNDEDFQPPPEGVSETAEMPEPKPEGQEWPLRHPKSPALSTGRPGTAGAGSYSTMPKIQGNSQAPIITSPRPIQQPIRVQEPPEDDGKKGCGCIIM